MSRHRLVRNLDYNAELEAYDGFSDSQEEEMTEEQHAQMIDGLEQVRNTLGDQDHSGFSDQAIKDALWEFFFDVDKSVVWLLEEKQKREAAKDRKDADGKPLPPLPPPEYGHHQYGPPPMGPAPPMPVPIHHPEYDEYADDGEYYHPDDYGSPEYPLEYNRLSTITERTERSEYSKHYPSARQVVYRDSISSNTEYGAFRDSRFTVTPLAPTHHLPQDSDSQSTLSTPKQRNALGLEMEPPHDYPPPPQPCYEQYEDGPPSPTTTESTIPPPPIEKSIVGTPKKSKLAQLAEKRSTLSLSSAQSFHTMSSRSFAVDSASILTYPILRPSQASRLSLSSAFAPSEASTSDSSYVRRAVDAALEQERLDQLETKPEGNPGRSPSGSTEDGSSTATETPRPVSQQRGARGTSKLAQLAQSKTKQHPETIVSWVKPPSATTRRSRVLETQEHSTRTKFVTPIGNGPTATTAITTSYQSLGNLMPRGVSGLPPSFPPPTDESRSTPSPVSTRSARPKSTSSQKPPSVNKPSSSSTHSRSSKLAMKAKQAQQQKEFPEADVIEDMRDPIKPIFLPTGEPNAKPSPFATVLLDEAEPGKKSRRRKDGSRRSRHDNEEVPILKTSGHVTNPPAFAFDVPSPDDMVFNARKGTSLSHRADARIKSGSPTTSRSSSHTVSSVPKRVSSTA